MDNYKKNDPLDEPKDATNKRTVLWSKTQNGDQNQIYPSLTLQTAKCFPLKRVKKTSRHDPLPALAPVISQSSFHISQALFRICKEYVTVLGLLSIGEIQPIISTNIRNYP